MDQQHAAEVLRNLDLRTKRMEQILPDLPTRAEMREAIDGSIQAAVAPLATREEMHEAIQTAVAPLATREEMHEAIQAAVAPLATKQEVRQGLEGLRDEMRRHMDVRIEEIGDRIKLLADGIQMIDEKHTRNYDELRQSLLDFRRTEAQHHAATMRNFDELRAFFRDYIKSHAREHVKIARSIDNLRGRVEKIEAKQPRKRKAS